MAALVPVVLLLLLVTAETRPSAKDNRQVLLSLFGSRLSSLIEATPDDVTEGSAAPPTSRSSSPSLHRHGNSSVSVFLDSLRRQVKTRRRSHKAALGGRGCFGMKLDRIGSISGLGC